MNPQSCEKNSGGQEVLQIRNVEGGKLLVKENLDDTEHCLENSYKNCFVVSLQ